MSAAYKVWIEVERYDEKPEPGHEECEEIDLPFGPCAQFLTEDAAIDYAIALFRHARPDAEYAL